LGANCERTGGGGELFKEEIVNYRYMWAQLAGNIWYPVRRTGNADAPGKDLEYFGYSSKEKK